MSWWKRFPIYQVYSRSFKDTNGDGVGDIKGVTEKVDYFGWLGVKTLWISPVYKSPMADFGYDISDYRDIDPLFGNMNDFKELLQTLHQKGMRLIMDFVPNHTSDQHAWFRASKAGQEPYTDFYVWRDGAVDPETKERRPPNAVMSVFGGPAWTWCEERSKWYLHHFLPEQPNLNYKNPLVRHEMKQVLKFWADLGVDGFRVDAVTRLGQDEAHEDRKELPKTDSSQAPLPTTEHAATFEAHNLSLACYEIIGEWVQFLKETYEAEAEPREEDKNGHNDRPPRRHVFLCTEGYSDLESVLRYYDFGVDFPFNFSLVNWTKKSTAEDLRRWVSEWMKRMPNPDRHRPRKRKHHRGDREPDSEVVKKRWPNWVAGNHDQSRPATRLGGSEYANVINTLLLTLPGTATLYQGDELGMLDVPVSYEQCQDPYGKRFGPEHYAEYTRDPCRSPIIWEADKKYGGFTSADNVAPWLPLSKDKSLYAVDRQRKNPGSYLNFFRRLLQLRDKEPVFHEFGHNVRLLAERDVNFFVYERWAPEEGPNSDYVIILNVSHGPDDEKLSVDLSHEVDLADHSATIAMTSCASDERQYGEGKEIDLASVKMKPGEVLIVQLEDKAVDAKKRKTE